MSLAELIEADRLPATEAPPRDFSADRKPQLIVESKDEPKLELRTERLDDEEGTDLWGVDVLSSGPPALPGVPVKSRDRLPLEDFEGPNESESYRPPWLEGELFPRIAPLFDEAFGGDKGIQTLLSDTWPWCTIGKVWSGYGSDFTRRGWGSGVLVGHELMLTASHNAPWNPGPCWMEFAPAYTGTSEPFGSTYVTAFRGVQNVTDVTGIDYVICRLQNSLGKQAGFMGYQWWASESPYYNGSWMSAGYPWVFREGERPQVRLDIGVRDIDSDSDGLEIETVNFTNSGWSGGPLWGFFAGDPRVIGVLSGIETDRFDPTRSVFAGGKRMASLITSPP